MRARPRLVVAALLALEAILLLWPATLGGEVFFRRDVHLMWHTQAEAYRLAWAQGAWPVWNPLVSFGQPMLADANNQVLYPFKLLLLVLPPWTVYTLYVVAHLVLAGAGAAFLARRLGAGRLAAAAAGGLWMASGPLLSVVDTWNQLGGAAWMPWAIAAGLHTVERASARGALGWGAILALQILAGSPESVALSIAGVAVLATVNAWRRAAQWRAIRARAAWTLAAGLLAVGLSAAQWVPALDAARRAGRTRLPREARVHWSVHPVNLVQAVCPVPLHRLALRPALRERLFGAPDPLLPSLYLGGVGMALAAAALVRPTRRTVGLALLGALAALVAMGGHAGLYDALVAGAPPLQAFRYPAKAMLLASLAWCVLGAFGLEAASAREGRRSLAAFAAAAGLVSAGAASLMAFGGTWLQQALAEPASPWLAARVLVAAVLAWTAAVVLLGRRTRPAPWLAVAAAADLFVAHHDLNPTAPVALYAHRPPAIAEARDPEGGRLYTVDYQEAGAGRRSLGRDVPYLLGRAPQGWDLRAAQALALREALFPPSPGAWGVEGSYDRDVPGLEPAGLALLKDAFRHAASPDARRALLRMGSVSRVAGLHADAGLGAPPLARHQGFFADPALVFAAPAPPLPREYVVGDARAVAGDAETLATILAPGFDAGREVVLDRGPAATAGPAFTGTVRAVERRSDRLSLDAETNAAGWVVVVDAWDPGWQARVDGRPVRLRRANLAFRAVPVPAGRHRVELVYRPSGIGPALAASLASLAVLAAGTWLARPHRGEPIA